MKLIGMDGLTTDETVTRYYWDGKELYIELWGERLQLAVCAAIKNLKKNITDYKKWQPLDPIDVQRLSACQNLLAELEKLPQ